jgi:hypothetical protein
MKIAIAFLALCASGWAQDIKMPPGIDKLAAKAKEHAEVTLDANMLGFASGLMQGKDGDEAKAKKLITGLKGIYVRSFEFDKEGEYDKSDLDAIRAQLQPPAWTRIISAHEKSESAEVFFKSSTGNQVGGLVVIAAEPKELTIVNISGTIRPEDIAGLSQFGVPNVDIQGRPKAEPQTGKKSSRGRDEE